MIRSVLFLFIFLVFAGAAPAEDRGVRISPSPKADSLVPLYSDYAALVIGTGDYLKGWPRLPNPPRDAGEVAEALKIIGFKPQHIRVVTNPTALQLRDAFNRLVKESNVETRAVFVYFAGHGHTLRQADGTPLGYIIPVDAPDPDDDLVGFMEKAVSMRDIETYSQLIKARHVLMLFDSCFSGALFTVMREKPSAFIEEKIARPVRQFITAGQENESVPDRSVFKEVFIQGVKDGYADLNRDGYVTGEELGYYMQEQVVNYSRKMQHPQFGKINNPLLDKGDFVFRKLPSSEDAARTSGSLKSEDRSAVADLAAKQEPVAQGNVGDADHLSRSDMLFVKGGCFAMGDLFGAGEADEMPVHDVCLKDFMIGKYEVTVGEFKKFVNTTGYRTDAESGDGCSVWNGKRFVKDHATTWQNPGFAQSDRHPVVCVSWNDALAFTEWLSEKTGKRFSLPSEAEWEYAARGRGNKQLWPGTDTAADLADYAWFGKNAEERSHSVGQRKPNSIGLFDMGGNVWEFVQDWYDDAYYSSSSKDDPRGPVKGEFRVVRGGSHRSPESGLRTSERYWVRPDYRSVHDGFRIAAGGDK